ncbi:carbohydrate kinase family protein [Paracoccus mutanolyticus]|uniref:hypothetical protein n=1 Tax=Paracoccus mutanolyticus TaxID=1499308 RepID=UPI001CB8EBB2|nr:hypothetical protein [Paracoccus mutanolyticus]
MIGQASAPMTLGEDVPGRIHQRPGGVALNVALALARQGLPPYSVRSGPRSGVPCPVGRGGAPGRRHQRLHRDPGPTGTYMAIEGPQGLVAAVADARGLEAAGPAILAPLRDGRLGDAGAPWSGTLVVDGNLTEPVLALIARAPWLSRAALRIVPASPDKAPGCGRCWPIPAPSCISTGSRPRRWPGAPCPWPPGGRGSGGAWRGPGR